jgi:hypothetical protein
MQWFWVWWAHYYPGLRYVFALNALGIGLILRAWSGDLYVLRGTVILPAAGLVTFGLILQLPGLLYLAVGWWSLGEMAAVLPGTEPPAVLP